MKKIKKKLKNEIEFAHEAGFEGMIIMVEDPENYIYLENIYEDAMLEDIVYENGWEEECMLINFSQNSSKIMAAAKEFA